MLAEALFILAGFTSPENIGTTPQSMLWLFPLAAAIAIVYKVTKLPKFTAGDFVREALLLFGSIIVFIAAASFVLCVLAWLATE